MKQKTINRVRIATSLIVWKAALVLMDNRTATSRMMKEAINIIEQYDPVLIHTQKLALKIGKKIHDSSC